MFTESMTKSSSFLTAHSDSSCGETVTDAPQGAVVLVPRGWSHGFTIEPGSTALLLVIPAGLEGYFRELGTGLAEGRSGKEVRESLAGRYDVYPDPAD